MNRFNARAGATRHTKQRMAGVLRALALCFRTKTTGSTLPKPRRRQETGAALFACAAAVLAIGFGLLGLGARAFAKTPPPGAGSGNVPAHILLMLDTSGSMSDLMGGPGTFDTPVDAAADASGNLFVASMNGGVSKFDASGNFVTSWGQYGTGTDNFNFYYNYGLTLDGSGRVYVCDYRHARVQVFDGSGTFVRSISLPGNCWTVRFNASSGELYAVYSGGISRYNVSTGARIATWTVTGTPYAVTFDGSGNRYVLSLNSSSWRIYTYNSSGTALGNFRLSSAGAPVSSPYGLAADTSGNLYVSDSDTSQNYVYKLTKKTASTVIKATTDIQSVTAKGGRYSSSAGYYKMPTGLTWSATHNDVLVADYYNSRIQKMNGSAVVISGQGETRLDQMKKVVKKIVSDSSLTDGAWFGMMQWNTSASMVTPISAGGAASIYTAVDNLTPAGNTYLDNAMTLAKSYLAGLSPLYCQKTMLVVVSDGYWVDTTASATAKSLYNDHGYKTYVIGFQTTGDNNYDNLSKLGGSYPESPLFAEDWQQLYDKLSAAIRKNIYSDLTFAAPTVMPDVADEDHIVQATFRYKSDHQWKGRLKRFKLTKDGFVGAEEWDAGDELNKISSDTRNIWTVASGLPSGLNNFTEANASSLQTMMNANRSTPMPLADTQKIIRFIRGKDAYGEFPTGADDDGTTLYAGDRWKLADVYRSRTLAVGAPDASASKEGGENTESYYRAMNGYKTFRESTDCGGLCATRRKMLYAGSNGGMLHAFDAETGKERWAFVPPMLTPMFKDTISPQANSSVSIYGVDGSPAVKDVFDGTKWRTVLICGLRQGGGGYFVLDVTSPDAPKHLYSISYDAFNEAVRYWNADGVMSVFSRSQGATDDFDLFGMGETWSDPLILRLPVGTGGAMKWAAVAGGGFNNRINNTYGSKLFFLDLIPALNVGPVLYQTDIPDMKPADAIANSVPARVTAVTADSSVYFKKKGAMLYVNDQQGRLWAFDATEGATRFNLRTLFDADSTPTNGRFVFGQTTPGFSEGKLYHLTASGDVSSPDAMSTSLDNRIWTVRDRSFPTAGSGEPSDFTKLTNATGESGACPSASALAEGWYAKIGSSGKFLSPPTLYNNTAMAPVYFPNSGNSCAGGVSSLLEYRFTCGKLIRETPLGNGVLTRATLYNNKIYLGVSDTGTEFAMPEGFVKTGNLIVGTPAEKRAPEVTVESWWEGK